MRGASWIDLAIILGYLTGIIEVALWSGRKTKNLECYALAGK